MANLLYREEVIPVEQVQIGDKIKVCACLYVCLCLCVCMHVFMSELKLG